MKEKRANPHHYTKNTHHYTKQLKIFLKTYQNPLQIIIENEDIVTEIIQNLNSLHDMSKFINKSQKLLINAIYIEEVDGDIYAGHEIEMIFILCYALIDRFYKNNSVDSSLSSSNFIHTERHFTWVKLNSCDYLFLPIAFITSFLSLNYGTGLCFGCPGGDSHWSYIYSSCVDNQSTPTTFSPTISIKEVPWGDEKCLRTFIACTLITSLTIIRPFMKMIELMGNTLYNLYNKCISCPLISKRPVLSSFIISMFESLIPLLEQNPRLHRTLSIFNIEDRTCYLCLENIPLEDIDLWDCGKQHLLHRVCQKSLISEGFKTCQICNHGK